MCVSSSIISVGDETIVSNKTKQECIVDDINGSIMVYLWEEQFGKLMKHASYLSKKALSLRNLIQKNI